MKRKLVQQAGQAFTVTIPVEWIRKNGLKAGDEIELEQIENELILKSNKKVVGGSLSLNLSDFPKMIKKTYLNAVYAKGFDQIILTLGKGEYPSLDQYIGYAIIHQKENAFIIKDVSGVSTADLDEIFKRIFQRIINFYESAIIDLTGSKSETPENIDKMDEEVNKLSLFLERQIMKATYSDPALGKILFTYSFNLEKISDDISRLWRNGVINQIESDNNIKEILYLAKQSLESAFSIYYRTDKDNEMKFLKLREKIRDKATKVKTKDFPSIRLLMYALNIAMASYDRTQLSLMKKMKMV